MSELVWGIHAVWSVLQINPKGILCAYVVSNVSNVRLRLLVFQLKKFGINCQERCCKWMDKKVNGSVHQGIIIQLVVMSPFLQESDLLKIVETCKQMLLLLVLDGITDPHNLGSCFRTAEASGVNAIVVPRDRSVSLNGTVRKVASGSADFVPFVRVINLARTLRLLKKCNVWIIGTSSQSNHFIYNKSRLLGPLALVMGSEGGGIRHLTQKCCDELVTIPVVGKVRSLNVSVATGVCLFEILRQRGNW